MLGIAAALLVLACVFLGWYVALGLARENPRRYWSPDAEHYAPRVALALVAAAGVVATLAALLARLTGVV